ncbi:hypothetical protein N9N28_05265 [Rubripirellula amarantea]|nr:hypothetical protein [Rubripirellula amarantea]
MAKNENLKRKLKAADRRRARRPDSTLASVETGADVSTTADEPDVAGLCVSEILRPRGRHVLADVSVIAALKGCLSGSVPDAADAENLYVNLNKIAKRDDVSNAAFRDAIGSLLKTATSHRDERDGGAFVRFLNILSS